MLELINLFVLRGVHTTAELPSFVSHLSWQRITLAGLWISIVLYFSDNSLNQGFFYMYNRLKKWYCHIRRRFWK